MATYSESGFGAGQSLVPWNLSKHSCPKLNLPDFGSKTPSSKDPLRLLSMRSTALTTGGAKSKSDNTKSVNNVRVDK